MHVFQVERERLGARIREARLATGMSHDRFAEKIGTSRQHLIKLEKGMHAPRPEMLARIIEATGQPVSFFRSTPRQDGATDARVA